MKKFSSINGEQLSQKIFSFEEVYEKCMKYFEEDSMAVEVFMNKYALKNDDSEFLEDSPDMMHNRLAKEFARIEKNYPNSISEEDIFKCFKNFKHISPQGSPMAAIGDYSRYQSLSNCFVIDGPYDSYGGILLTDQEQAQIMKRRGGVGFDISRIRPRGLKTANAALTTDGIGVFMKRYSNTCEEVAQGGRRGALMLTIDCRHPQIEDFISKKTDNKSISSANISIRFTDKFMKAVQGGKTFQLQWPVDSEEPEITKTVDAKEVWDKFVNAAWTCADPGIQFSDTMRRTTPSDAYSIKGFGTVSTNPCGEIGMSANDSCRLLLLNALSYVDNPYTASAKFNFKKFKKYVKIAQRLLDDLVDLELEAIERILKKIESDPEPEHTKIVERNLWNKIYKVGTEGRRTGLGLTALADVVAALGQKYGSKESLKVIDSLYKEFALSSHEASVDLAEERGAFPAYEPGLFEQNEFIQRLMEHSSDELNARFEKYGRRSICNTTMPPAGSTSLMCRTSNGIENILFLEGRRRRRINNNDKTARVDEVDENGDKWQYYDIFHRGHALWMNENPDNDEKDSPYFGSCVMDIDPIVQIEVQATVQRWIEHSISKTVNLPADATEEQISEIYLKAWELGCKGTTVYRYGSKKGIVFDKESNTDDEQIKFSTNVAPQRPKSLPCDIHNTTVKGEKWTILIGLMDGRPYEEFAGLSKYIEIPRKMKHGTLVKNGKKGGIVTYNLAFGDEDDQTLIKDVVNVFDNPLYGALTRVISLSLRHGAPIQYVVEQLQKDKYSDITSFSRVTARVLKNYIPDGTDCGPKCEQCGGNLVYVSSCAQCQKCGNTLCG